MKKEHAVDECKKSLKNYRLKSDTYEECIQFYYDFVTKSKNKKKWVLNAKPGHGKTSTLYAFIVYIIQNTEIPIMLVFKEKKQQTELKKFLEKNVDSDILQRKFSIFNTDDGTEIENAKQVIVITHARMEKIMLLKNFNITIKDMKLLKFGNADRKIIFDEQPKLFYYDTFNADNNEWFSKEIVRKYAEKIKYKTNFFGKNIKIVENNSVWVYLRCLISLILAKELLLNPYRLEREGLKKYVDISDMNILSNFYDFVIKQIKSNKIYDLNFIKKFLFFYKILTEANIGTIVREQKYFKQCILVSECQNFNNFSNDFLILDGTSNYFNSEYETLGFELHSIIDYTKYSTVTIFQRNINTSSKNLKKKRTQGNIIEDISMLNKDSNIFPIANKDIFEKINPDDINLLVKETEKKINENDDIELDLNLFNTRGKNKLRKYNNIYLVGLPIKPPAYYFACAHCFYQKTTSDLVFNRNRKNIPEKWFGDSVVENIFLRDISSELHQIMTRTSLRNLDGKNDINIYIATTRQNVLKYINDNTEFKNIIFSNEEIKNIQKMKNHLDEIKEYFSDKPIGEAITIGRINQSLRTYVNNLSNKKELYERFKEDLFNYGIDIKIQGKRNYKHFVKIK